MDKEDDKVHQSRNELVEFGIPTESLDLGWRPSMTCLAARMHPHTRISCTLLKTNWIQGEYNFSYLTGQDCRKLKKKKVKVRPTGFLAPAETRSTGSGSNPPAGGATGAILLLRATRNQLDFVRAVSPCEASTGRTVDLAAFQSDVPIVRNSWPIFRPRQREPD
eukprot:2960634-Amphidinium_carterae.1